MYKNLKNKIISRHFNVINSTYFTVIRGTRLANLDCRISSGNDNVESVIDHKKKNTITFKGLDVVRQYAALWERRVQSSTRAQKFPADGVQYGRSMIEMLGVLAIIGVLSVGGIAGYSKALTRWKINKTTEQIVNFVTEFTTIYANSKVTSEVNYDYLYSDEPEDFETMKGIGLIPPDMNDKFINPFGGKYLVEISDYDVIFSIYDLPPEACISLATTNWNVGNGSYSDVYVNSANASYAIPGDCASHDYGGSQYGDGWAQACAIDNGLPMSPLFAEHGCTCKNNDCLIILSIQKP